MIGKFCLTIIIISLCAKSYGQQACGRTAVINNQPVLVDISSASKGEGLRPYLDKDAIAKSYLDQYQTNNLSPNQSAIIGSVAIGLVLGGATMPQRGNEGPLKAGTLIAAGLSLLAVNFLVVQGLEFKNENLLRKSIDEYNKRNRPKIYFLPYENRWSYFSGGKQREFGLIAGLQASF